MKDAAIKIDIFKVTGGNKVLNAVYSIGNVGYWPFWLYVESSCYFCNVVGTSVGTTLTSDAVSFTKIRDDNAMLQNMQVAKDSGDNVRIKISIKQATNFIGIMPVRLNTGDLISHSEALN